MAGLTKEQRAKRLQEQKALEAARMQILVKIGKGELTAEEGAKLLSPVNEVRVITVTRVVKDNEPTNRIKIAGLYSRYPVTLYASHIVRLVDEGHWDKVVEMARAILEEGGESLELDAPPTEEGAAPPTEEGAESAEAKAPAA